MRVSVPLYSYLKTFIGSLVLLASLLGGHDVALAVDKEAFIGDFVYANDFYRGFIYNRMDHEGKLIPGKEAWIFFEMDLRDIGRPFTDGELRDRGAFFAKLKRHADDKGIKIVFFIAPSTPSIYPEYLPESMKIRSPSASDQLSRYLTDNSVIDVVYPKEALLKEKGKYKLYYKTDAHWTEIGAFFGVEELMKRTGKWFPNSALRSIDDYRIVTKRNFGVTLAKRLGLASYYLEDRIFLKPKFAVKDRSVLPKALVIHDSYYDYAQDLLKENFNVTEKELKYEGKVSYDEKRTLNEIIDEMDKIKPKIVILLFCERGYERLFDRRG